MTFMWLDLCDNHLLWSGFHGWSLDLYSWPVLIYSDPVDGIIIDVLRKYHVRENSD